MERQIALCDLARNRSATSPLERGGDFVGARRTEIELIRVARIRKRSIDSVCQVSDAKRRAHAVDVPQSDIPAGNIHERIDVHRSISLHCGEVVFSQEAVSDMTHRPSDLDRPPPSIPTI